MADTTMNLKISADIGELTEGLAKAQAALKDFGTQVANQTGTSTKAATAAQQRQIQEITQTLAAAAKPLPAPKPQGEGGLLAILGIEHPQAQVNQAMSQAQAAFAQKMAQLQTEFAASKGTGDLGTIVKTAMDTHESGDKVQQQFAGMNNGQTTAALTQQFDQAVKLQTAFNAQMKQLSSQGSAAWAKDWQSVVTPVGSALSTSFNKVIQSTESVGRAASEAAQSITMSFITASERMAVKWVADRLAELTATNTVEAAKTTATGAGAAATAAVQTTAAQAGKLAQTEANSTSILSSAKTAAAGAYAAVSGIPLVGPFLAPAAAAAAFAGVMAFDILSAEGGLEKVPFDGMPAILHENETVMPAHVANPMRDFFADYQGPTAAANDGGGDTHVHVSYAPAVSGRLSRADLEGTLRDHAGVLARHVGNALRNRP